MILLFYRARYGRWYDRLVGWWTGGPYSHVELVVGQFHGQPLCVSSSPRDGGVRAKIIPLSTRWDEVDFPLSHEQQADVIETARWLLLERRKYDWFGPLGNSKKRMHCAEAVVRLLQSAGVLPHVTPKKTTPNMLYKLLRKNNE